MGQDTTGSASIQSREDYENNPRSQYDYWLKEIKASQDFLREFHKEGDKINSRYLDDRKVSQTLTGSAAGSFKLNLFNSNIKTMSSMLYGKLPKIEADRRNASQNDDVGRVAAETMERMLKLDLAENGKEYDATFRAVLQDRLLPGLGCARVRYEVETEPDISLATENGERVDDDTEQPQKLKTERAPIDYYHWSDVLWGWARTFSQVPWISFRSYLTKDEVEAQIGEWAAENVKKKKKKATISDDDTNDKDDNSEWMKAEIWEIWDKERRKVVWVSVGVPKVLDTKEDPLQLTGFFPCPPFFLANATTQLYRPTADYHLAQDLYNEIDILQTRIAIITEACKVIGVYDASCEGIKRVFKEGVENDLIPVDNWALFAEKGGIQGQIDWVPIVEIASVLDKLRSLRDETIGLLQQITGMADVMRGELDNQYEGVGQTQQKAKFGSIRVQALQEEFAVFVSDLMQLKAEIIARHFSPETIIQQSNMEFSPDIDILPQAVQLIKQPEKARIRIFIRSETLAMLDYAQLREERAAYLNGLSTFLQSATPLIQQDKRSLPFLLEMLKWAMAGFKGSSEIEGVLDRAIETMQQPEQQQEEQEPDPEQQRMQGQLQLEQMRIEGKQKKLQQKHMQDSELREQDKIADIETRQAGMQFNMQQKQLETEAELNILAAKMEADVQTELMTSQINAEQQAAGIEAQTEADIRKARFEIEKLKITKRADAGLRVLEKRLDGENKRQEQDNAPVKPKNDS